NASAEDAFAAKDRHLERISLNGSAFRHFSRYQLLDREWQTFHVSLGAPLQWRDHRRSHRRRATGMARAPNHERLQAAPPFSQHRGAGRQRSWG
ncbi:hypothetical protein, partial [Reyranella sp.]|uniref:hypothetical protein n=1 Tax=Reyranella sp. TaxID=1929291 RepID=UPI003782E9F8